MTGPPLSASPLQLGVNIDHVATVRQARRGAVPDILAAAETVTAAGADGITIHLREDRRHIQDADLALLAPRFRVNLEMAASEEMTRIAIASSPRPHAACLVPERREELTTEGGLDVISNQNRVRDCCTALREAGILVSLFIEPDPRQIEAAAAAGAEFIELHTGRYADVFSRGDARSCASTGETDVELGRLMKAGESARRLGLRVNAGHGLDLANVGPVLAIPGLEELNIGFSIIAHALFVGLAEATREMKARMTR